jgi:hypothetical protein
MCKIKYQTYSLTRSEVFVFGGIAKYNENANRFF